MENMVDLNQKIMLWLAGMLAILFIVIGSGVLLRVFLPGSQLGQGTRLIFGGFILLYGLIRSYMIVRKWRKQNRPKSAITIDEDRHNQ
jgi:hypothetical protein